MISYVQKVRQKSSWLTLEIANDVSSPLNGDCVTIGRMLWLSF